MTPSEIRWRCERMAELLPVNSRLEAIAIVATEARTQPWLLDPRPAPQPLPMGCFHA